MLEIVAFVINQLYIFLCQCILIPLLLPKYVQRRKLLLHGGVAEHFILHVQHNKKTKLSEQCGHPVMIRYDFGRTDRILKSDDFIQNSSQQSQRGLSGSDLELSALPDRRRYEPVKHAETCCRQDNHQKNIRNTGNVLRTEEHY